MLEDFNSSDEDSDDGFLHKALPVFARNKKIRQELDARQRKQKIELKQDRLTWSPWDKRRAVLVGLYNSSTHDTQAEYQRTT